MRSFKYLSHILLLILVASVVAGASGCPNGPVIECNDTQKTYPCPDGSCALTPSSCPTQDIDCPKEYPFRCDSNHCADGTNQCVPNEDGSPASEWISAPEGLPNY